jgi:Ca-activated chloride channel family protein
VPAVLELAPAGSSRTRRCAARAQPRAVRPFDRLAHTREGGTALYDAILAAQEHLRQNPTPDRISAIVVLTDGEDRNSRTSLRQLLDRVRADEEAGVKVFTIGYGKGANEKVLEGIADATQAKFYRGTTQNIREVFKEISTFF